MTDKTYKLINVVGTSEKSVTEAMRNGVKKAAQTLHNLDWVEVEQVRGRIENDEIKLFQVTMKIGFRLD